jgi:environmental stress-induced protein Ves
MQNSTLDIIRKSSFTASPWKNGGGITHEAIRVPAGGGAFRWRVSVAHIDASGPFSEFAGYRRTMVLLRGAGIELRFADGTAKSLRRVGEWIQFDGAVPAHCDLLDGPCVDLNLMVSQSDRVEADVLRLGSPLAVGAAQQETLLLIPVDGSVRLKIDGGASAAGTPAGEAVTLEPWDLAILHGHGRLCGLEPSAAASTAVFLARLKFASGE